MNDYKQYLKSLTPEQRLEMKRNRVLDRERRAEEKAMKAYEIGERKRVRRELAVLKFMAKHDVLYYHHGQAESIKDTILRAIERVKITNRWNEYNSYIWNYQGEGNNYLPICQFGNIFSSPQSEGKVAFETIYDVPLDGTYKFCIVDSGQRGLGTLNHIRAVLVNEQVNPPKVNPGALRF